MIKTAMQETSLYAYDDLKSSGKLSAQQATILSKLSHGRDYSLQEIKHITGYEINVVSGRVHDLKQLNLLIECDKRKCSFTNKTITPVRLPQKQESLF